MLLGGPSEERSIQEPVTERLMLEGYTTYPSPSINIPRPHGNTELFRSGEITPPLTHHSLEWNGSCKGMEWGHENGTKWGVKEWNEHAKDKEWNEDSKR